MSTAVETKTCCKCGQPLGGLAPAGVCPRCLLMTGLGDTDPGLARGPDQTGDYDLPRHFGDYELLEEIARGGMGIVYKARQSSLDRIVAVKMLLFGQYTSAEFVQRFRIEASAAASLQHTNIVAVHEVGVYHGQHYFAMDFVDGPNLAQFVRDKPLPGKRAAAYLKAIAEAIEFAHQRCVLHRDLKPSNVLIGSNDQPRVTDFGLAKRFAISPSTNSTAGTPGDAATPNWDLTVTGQMLGSPNYMPPEQVSVQRGKIGPHSDVYSLGAVLYYALTARPPFMGETVADTLQQVLHSDPVAPRLLNPAVPADLETICLKCLEHDTAKRYATAQDLADELTRFLRGEPIHARPVMRTERAWRWCRRNPALAVTSGIALVFLLMVAIGSPVVAYRINQARKSARENLYAADITAAHRAIEEGDLGRARTLLQEYIASAGKTDLRGFEWRYLADQLSGDQATTILTNVNPARQLCVSPDGRLLGAGPRLWNVASRRIESDLGTNCNALAFAPLGQTLLFRRGSGVPAFVRRDLATGSDTTLLEGETAAAIAFSPTGRWMASGTDRGLRLWDTTKWQLVASQTNAPFDQWPLLQRSFTAFNWFSAKGLAFSPDEQTLVAATGFALSGRSELSAWKIPSLERVSFPSNSVEDAACVVFAPDGREFLTGNWDGSVRFWNAATFTEIPSRHLLNAHRSWIAEMAFVPGTRRLVTAGSDRCLRIWETEGLGTPITLRGHSGSILAMTMDPGGKVYTDSDDRTIRQWRPELPVLTDQALAHFGSPLLPAGLCDQGSLIATLSEHALHFWRYGGGKVSEDLALRKELTDLGKLPLNWRKLEGMASVSPNRKWLAVARPRERIEVVDLTSPQPRHFLPGGSAPDQYLAFSPDSTLLLARRSVDGTAIFDTSTWQEIALIQASGDVDSVFPFHFAARNPLLALADSRSVVLWNTTTRQKVKQIQVKQGGELIAFGISADARMLAMGYTDDTITLHDCSSGELVDTIRSHLSGVEWVAFSPDGKTLATASGRLIKLWNVPTRREMFSLDLPSMVIYVAFTPDGNGLLTAEMSGITHLWRAPPMDAFLRPQQAQAE